jgi:high-affinity iron transporter
MIFIFNLNRACLLLLFVALAALGRPARADTGDASQVEAQRLIHILGYTASDYGGAVKEGAVVSQLEYDEQLSLLSDAQKIAETLKAHPGVPPDLSAAVSQVRSLVEKKASAEQVSAAVGAVRTQVITAFRLVQAPTAQPDRQRAEALFAEHCASCHGQTGRADTPRAASLTPRPANFHDPQIAESLSPSRVASTVRFGITGTAMMPFTFLSDEDRWALGFYVTGLHHAETPLPDKSESLAYTLAELAVRSDTQLTEELRAAGIPPAKHRGIVADLRRRAPFEPGAAHRPLAIARGRLDQARAAIGHGDRAVARSALIDAYLEGIEPIEGPLRALDGALVLSLEERFLGLRARLDEGAPPSEIDAGIAGILGDLTRADMLLATPSMRQSFLSAALSSGGIVLREGVEAALLIAALLGVAVQAGLGDRRRYVHFGWASALGLGVLTWILSSRLIALSGASRELIEGVTALLATLVLFYVSYALLAKREVARWMKFLRAQVSPRRAALSLFGVAFLAAYREAFETVLFYQALLASNTSTFAVIVGAFGGAVALVALVAAYSRAGKFAPPQVFFKISSYLLYALAIIFAGQGIAALQLTAVLPIHPLPIPSIPALGVFGTLETCLAQGILLALAIFGAAVTARHGAAPAGPSGGSQNPVIAKPAACRGARRA